MQDRHKTILEEIVYDRVRASVNLCQLVIIEQELEECIQRAMTGADVAMDDAAARVLARQHVDQALTRIEREWRALRDELAAAEGG